ncbi:hypothetical protein EYF80_035044 [Liparis tanakae]|uniref:Uncharacterized protein n=1 Tax=Liparis tanakae TaxID=230148 RepID=A0A4Z2GNC7_9TELE|nr:hypothetical protein EYF80_035044 [Liparis tanakae]
MGRLADKDPRSTLVALCRSEPLSTKSPFNQRAGTPSPEGRRHRYSHARRIPGSSRPGHDFRYVWSREEGVTTRHRRETKQRTEEKH